MGYEIVAKDITELECDVIINSLGCGDNITSYGALCNNILNKAGRLQLELDIKKHKDGATPGNMFITSGYKLHAHNIIHIFTPFYVNDKQLYKLEYVYMRALKEALDKKRKCIGLPIIGTGANGYPFGFVSRMVENLVKKFVELYPKMTVFICEPIEDYKTFDDKFDLDKVNEALKKFYKRYPDVKIRDFIYKNDRCFEECYDRHWEEDFIHSSVDMEEHVYREKFMLNYDEYREHVKFKEELEAILESGKRPVKVEYIKKEKNNTKVCIDNITMYIEEYMRIRFKANCLEKVIKHEEEFLGGSDGKSSLKSKHSKPDKRDTIPVSMLMRYVIALRMTREEADDFLKFCGKCFSPASTKDNVYMSLIKEKRFRRRSEINELCDFMHIDKLFGYQFDPKID